MTTVPELAIHSAEDFENLPDDGIWEAADGKAILLPGNEYDHQWISRELTLQIDAELKRVGRGHWMSMVNMDIPAIRGEGFRTRVPDLLIYEHRPSGKRFHWQDPPKIAVEILAVPRGNIERTTKVDDYARAEILEYWIVDPFERAVEIYRLNGDRYDLAELAIEEIQSTALPGLRIDLRGLFDIN